MFIKTFTLASLIAVACLPFNGQAQDAVYYQSFDRLEQKDIDRAGSAVSESPSYFLVHAPSYSQGLSGLALDLTDDVAFRIPLSLLPEENPAYTENASFAVQVWVQTKPGALQGTPILTNTAVEEGNKAGWCIGTQENGAWYLKLSDGNSVYAYEPTAERQAVNDGRWHQITVSIDREKEEAWMYFDGRNVAIYRLEGLKSMESKLLTIVGGSDEQRDWECRGEWMAFNGKVDEVRLWNRTLTAGEVADSYRRFFPDSEPNRQMAMPGSLKVQAWNIWHGGRRFGKHVGVNRVIDVLRQENADIIGLVETYGSGAVIADALGYHFYLISSNLSILSRYPIEESIRLYHSFNSGGAVIRLNDGYKLAFFDIWLNYLPDISNLHKGKQLVEKFQKEERETRLAEIKQILKEMEAYTANAEQMPVIMSGDFNTSSCLDWKEETRPIHKGLHVDMPVCRRILEEGYTDSFRHLSPDVLLNPGNTWSPLINLGAKEINCIPQRIDFIFYKGDKLAPLRSETLQHYPKGWPSDHASVVTTFGLK